MNARVVVTGGSGRLGRSVVDVLRDAGHEVFSVDRAPRAEPAHRVREIIADISDDGVMDRILREVSADTVVHLAAIAVPFSAPDDVIYDTNVGLAQRVFEAAVSSGVRRVLVASSPTVLGYGDPAGWVPQYLPLDEAHPTAAWNGYARSKVEIERMTRTFARENADVRFGSFRPCFVIAPEEWRGEPTQQGHTVTERLDDPALAAVALFNYVDARDAGAFVAAWITRTRPGDSGEVYFVGARDALAREPLRTLLPRLLPDTAAVAAGLPDDAAAFSAEKARRELGWVAERSWRSELCATPAS